MSTLHAPLLLALIGSSATDSSSMARSSMAPPALAPRISSAVSDGQPFASSQAAHRSLLDWGAAPPAPHGSPQVGLGEGTVDQDPRPPASDVQPDPPGELGDPVPEFGEAIWHHLPPTPFETLRGKTVLVDVFRTW